jgi:uncharacterized protein YaaW (UPF0174 family)
MLLLTESKDKSNKHEVSLENILEEFQSKSDEKMSKEGVERLLKNLKIAKNSNTNILETDEDFNKYF